HRPPSRCKRRYSRCVRSPAHARVTPTGEQRCACSRGQVGKRHYRYASPIAEEVFHLSHRASAAPSRKSSEIAAREAHIDSAASVFRRAHSRTPIVCAGNLSGHACPEDNFFAPMPWRNRKSAHHSAGLLSFLVLCICAL